MPTLQIMLVITVLEGGHVHQSDPEQVASMEECIERGKQAVDPKLIGAVEPDGIRALGFSCVLRLPPAQDRPS
jgi:hypothetical protein